MTSHELAIQLIRLPDKHLDIDFVDNQTMQCITLDIEKIDDVNDVIEIRMVRS